jgi:alkanesulfonate monooxygenase SsuD/methylene tetrahydromethanopterin reductase-like flavin-dependent oxidoreductase (luciferase family)
MAGRGSFIESFPLFGYNLEDYDELFAEKLDLLLAIRDSVKVTWSGNLRAPINDRGVYPRPFQDRLPIWIAIGGTPQSAARAGALGLPLALAIIGGEPARFAPLFDLYREAAKRSRQRSGRPRHQHQRARLSSPKRPSRRPTISTARRPK